MSTYESSTPLLIQVALSWDLDTVYKDTRIYILHILDEAKDAWAICGIAQSVPDDKGARSVLVAVRRHQDLLVWIGRQRGRDSHHG